MDSISTTRRPWLRFSLSHLFVLTLGIGLGFAPLKLWELGNQGEPRIHAQVRAIEIPCEQLASLGMQQPASGGISLADLDPKFSQRLAAMVEEKQAKVLAEPTLVTVSGRMTSLNVGGELPIPVTADDGTQSVSYREIGTRIDLLPTLLRNGRIRLELHTEFSVADEPKELKGVVIESGQIPAFRFSKTQTEIDLKDGETVVLCADCQYQPSASAKSKILLLATIEKAKSQ